MKWDGNVQKDKVREALTQLNVLPVRTMIRDKCSVSELSEYIKSVFKNAHFKPNYESGYEMCIVDNHVILYFKDITFENEFDGCLSLTWRQCAKELITMNTAEKEGTTMQTFICKCGKTFQKSTKSESTGYVLEDYSPEHECYGCPYIVHERDWITHEIKKTECRATPEITYGSRCYINTESGDHTACYIYSLDLMFIKRIFNYMKSLDGVIHEDDLNTIPEEWRAADFASCHRFDDCQGLAAFPLYFEKNKKGTEARREVKNTFFTPTGRRKNMSEEYEREVVLNRIEIAIENAHKADIREAKNIIPLEDLDMNIRAYNALKRYGINYVSDFEKALQSENSDTVFSRIGRKFIKDFYRDYDNYIQENENMANIDFKALKNARKAIEDEVEENIPEELESSYTSVWGAKKETVTQIEVTRLVAFTDEEGNTQPFKLNRDKVEQIKASAADVGIIVPLRVRRKGDIYEIISGHHRLAAAKELGQLTVPCLVGEYDDEKAYKVLAESNIQRSQTLPSEYGKIFARYKELAETEELSIEEIGKKFGVSQKTVYRYLSLNSMTEEVQELVDNGMINFNAVEVLKSLSNEEQRMLCEVLADKGKKLTLVQAKKIADLAEGDVLDTEMILSVFESAPKPTYKSRVYNTVASKYSVNMTEKELDELTEKLLGDYFQSCRTDSERR